MAGVRAIPATVTGSFKQVIIRQLPVCTSERFRHSSVAVPLTPALSPRRGSTFALALDKFAKQPSFAALPIILPLPKGEGWGEGKESSEFAVADKLKHSLFI